MHHSPAISRPTSMDMVVRKVFAFAFFSKLIASHSHLLFHIQHSHRTSCIPPFPPPPPRIFAVSLTFLVIILLMHRKVAKNFKKKKSGEKVKSAKCECDAKKKERNQNSHRTIVTKYFAFLHFSHRITIATNEQGHMSIPHRVWV
jgi:flagellar biosynthesis component FlhA